MTALQKTASSTARKKIVVVSPFYNEEESLGPFLREIDKVLTALPQSAWQYSILLINDGSTDNSLTVLFEVQRKIKTKVKVINLAVNSGHQNALWAGIENSPTDSYMVAMDCDLQDPPHLLKEFLDSFDQGFEVVLTQRISRKDRLLKRISASIYYRALRFLAPQNLTVDSGDFFGLNPSAKIRLLSHHESSKYIRGLIQLISTNMKIIQFHRNARDAGETKYTFSKMLKLAISGLTGFSIRPLILSIYVSLFGLFIGIIAGLYLFFSRLDNPSLYPAGYAFSNLVLILLSLFTLFILSILCVYLSMIVIEIKNRPIYFINETTDLEKKAKRFK